MRDIVRENVAIIALLLLRCVWRSGIVTVSAFGLFDSFFHADRVENQFELFLDFRGVAGDKLADGVVLRQPFQVALSNHQVQ